MSSISPTFGGSKPFNAENSLFKSLWGKQWGRTSNQGLNDIDQCTQTSVTTGTPLESVRKLAEEIGVDVVLNFGQENERRAPDRFCKTMRKTVKEVSDRHDIALKAMVNKLKVDDTNAFKTFVSVADEIFEDGQINWGRVIIVYAFGARLGAHLKQIRPGYEDKIALYVGKYVANKLGRWILDNGGWNAFSDFFSDENAVEDKVWKGLLFTATLGSLGALAAVMAR